MAKSARAAKPTLDSRFKFAEASFHGLPGGWTSLLTPATGIDDGEQYLLRLFKKTGSAIDADLRNLIGRGLRRIRRVLSSRLAQEVLVSVLEVVEDDDEIGILMLDPGSPLRGHAQGSRGRQGQYLVSSGRLIFWRNMVRVARGLTLCHDAGIVHGSVSVYTIFSHGDDREDYRLGGYETCVHIADSGLAGAATLTQSARAISFRQDWIDLGRTASELLGVETAQPPALLSIERRILERLSNPPQFQLYDGRTVLQELAEVVEELERAGSSTDAELVLYPSRQALQSDLASLASGAIAASDVEAVLAFVERDLHAPSTRVAVSDRGLVRIVTDLAIYTIEIVDPKVGSIRDAHKRRPGDWSAYDATDLTHRIHLARNRNSSDDRVRWLGPAAKNWTELGSYDVKAVATNDSPIWYALILLEAFSLLREQFRIYPIEVLTGLKNDRGMVWVVPVADAGLDDRRANAGFKPIAESMARELSNDDGRANWTLSRSDTLGGDRERAPQLNFEGTEVIGGKKTYAFTTGDVVVPDHCYLRPRRDSGFERAVRRRLQNIVAARSNVELLRALDDPAQVLMDEALRDIAAPGPVPSGTDQSKAAAWNAIREGQSINLVVGPPGVGKTYLISNLVKSILSLAPDARILIAAQNHDTLVHMEKELKKELRGGSQIVVRIERTQTEEKDSTMRARSRDLLQSASLQGGAALMFNQLRQIKQALDPIDDAEQAEGDRVHRDTENLLVRSSDITLATTSSYVIEEMIADGDQFDWTIVEEAARANGAEMIGALLLGNRRLLIGDHKQLSPFDHLERQKMYDGARAAELLRDARTKLGAINDLPSEVDEALQQISDDRALLQDVLAISARMEEPFRSTALREAEREKTTGRASRFVNTLLEQSRMHPTICRVVSTTFYGGELVPSDRVVQRKPAVVSHATLPNSPVIVLNLPPLSKVDRPAFEVRVGRSLRNDVEAKVLLDALKHLRPVVSDDGRLPTLAVLSPYKAQVDHLKRSVVRQIKQPAGTLQGFASPRGDGNFVFTSDSFQGSEADVVLASLVRNNQLVGSRALGFMKNPQRVNVLMSRARHKLIIVSSLEFIEDAVNGVYPDRLGGELDFLLTIVDELRRLSSIADVGQSARIVDLDSNGAVKL
ncbi:AAA domain-containing protein (plasmid) [Agrobacterium tumefaciens]|uniref:DEAD/DEAH box helicase n=1 Tax=Agrobacterium tumefaciens TaxID=358 RepID=UPI001574E26D|nr:AAA domain-containing protein [Agrobacterium tumefaciens]NSZ87627.1 helicase [Agrobacterium tumefaciens]WCA72952.1 AAA domain-containing protein [Agrobacterium tumefaciens]